LHFLFTFQFSTFHPPPFYPRTHQLDFGLHPLPPWLFSLSDLSFLLSNLSSLFGHTNVQYYEWSSKRLNLQFNDVHLCPPVLTGRALGKGYLEALNRQAKCLLLKTWRSLMSYEYTVFCLLVYGFASDSPRNRFLSRDCWIVNMNSSKTIFYYF
jgi:hypothetical protein